MQRPTKNPLVVFVGRSDVDGKLFSEVRHREPVLGQAVVIDRGGRRMMDPDTLKRRAQALAELLGLEYIEDMTWHCVAMKKIAGQCFCPKCQERGAV